jgi:hypothetical protein
MSGEPTSAFVLLLEGTGRDDVTVARFPDSLVNVQRGATDVASSTQMKG